MSNYKRFDEEMIKNIEYGLETCNTASELAYLLKIDVSGLIKHIKKCRTLKEHNYSNKCGNKYICKKTKVCPSCYYDYVKYKPTVDKDVLVVPNKIVTLIVSITIQYLNLLFYYTFILFCIRFIHKKVISYFWK